ncbi:MAG: acetyl-CoA carboxylase biotin carboxyl carrier protein subunit [Ignavibacteria bacterium]|nr:acetyl-CoA carboxylase biotin carboxyl carrier protein subunit [Ignavibacteria bacterium]
MEDKNLTNFSLEDSNYITTITKKYQKRKRYQPQDLTKLRAFIPGIIQKIYVVRGQEVRRGQPILVLEAMKMKNDVFSPVDAKVKEIKVKVGEAVAKDQILVEFEL